MRTRLTGLFNLIIDRLYEKRNAVKLPVGGSVGVFFLQKGIPLELYIDYVYDEHADVNFRLQYMCSCELPVYRLASPVYGFGCLHCDSVCTVKECEDCVYLHAVDLGAEDADL